MWEWSRARRVRWKCEDGEVEVEMVRIKVEKG